MPGTLCCTLVQWRMEGTSDNLGGWLVVSQELNKNHRKVVEKAWNNMKQRMYMLKYIIIRSISPVIAIIIFNLICTYTCTYCHATLDAGFLVVPSNNLGWTLQFLETIHQMIRNQRNGKRKTIQHNPIVSTPLPTKSSYTHKTRMSTPSHHPLKSSSTKVTTYDRYFKRMVFIALVLILGSTKSVTWMTCWDHLNARKMQYLNLVFIVRCILICTWWFILSYVCLI